MHYGAAAIAEPPGIADKRGPEAPNFQFLEFCAMLD